MTLDDGYTYPGSGGVLVNRLGIRDPARLDEALNDYATVAWVHLRQQAPPEPPGLDYLQHIHRELFSPVLDWAGELRRTDVQATGTGIPYARPEYIQESLQSLFGRLQREDFLTGLDAATFADRLADRWGELSAIHPFRDGNTRSQSAYVSAIADRAGYPIDWTGIDVDSLRTLRLEAVVGRTEPLAGYLRDHLVEAGRDPLGPTLQFRSAVIDAARIAAMDRPVPPTSKPPAAAPRRPEAFGSTAYRPGRDQGGPDLGR